jgi:L-ascorbate metabolism protein UlaG (beta-lactamase superfamily)
MNISFLGHSCFLLDFGGKQLLVDPFISANELAKDIDINTLNPDYILLTHGHQDHILDAESIAKQSGAIIISNYEIYSDYIAKGLKAHPMNHGGKFQFSFGTVKYVNAVHSSSFADGSYAGNPGGFVIWNKDECIYIAGDTALSYDMKLIPLTCPKLSVAVLPIGDNFTMGYHDAVIASDFIECDNIIACHYNTFPPIKTDLVAAKKAFEDKGKRLTIMAIGETI